MPAQYVMIVVAAGELPEHKHDKYSKDHANDWICARRTSVPGDEKRATS